MPVWVHQIVPVDKCSLTGGKNPANDTLVQGHIPRPRTCYEVDKVLLVDQPLVAGKPPRVDKPLRAGKPHQVDKRLQAGTLLRVGKLLQVDKPLQTGRLPRVDKLPQVGKHPQVGRPAQAGKLRRAGRFCRIRKSHQSRRFSVHGLALHGKAPFHRGFPIHKAQAGEHFQ